MRAGAGPAGNPCGTFGMRAGAVSAGNPCGTFGMRAGAGPAGNPCGTFGMRAGAGPADNPCGTFQMRAGAGPAPWAIADLGRPRLSTDQRVAAGAGETAAEGSRLTVSRRWMPVG